MWVEKEIESFYAQIEPLERVLFRYSNGEGPTIIFVGGVHGNEPLGVKALQTVGKKLAETDAELLNGTVVGLVGNLSALKQHQRFVDEDLNRVWIRENLDNMHYDKMSKDNVELLEMSELYNSVKQEIEHALGEVYLIDLHTTSAPTTPFIVTNKNPTNIGFVSQFPIPHVHGLTGFLDGTLLNYITDLGHCGLAYEAGQHLSLNALARHESFIWLSLFYTGFLDQEYHHEEMDYHLSVIEEKHASLQRGFKIISRYKISEGEDFQMLDGFKSFDRVEKGEIIASNDQGSIKSPYDAYIFMPKYQKEGNDGFFLIQREE